MSARTPTLPVFAVRNSCLPHFAAPGGQCEGFVPISQTPGKNLTFAQGRLLLDTNGGNPGGNFVLGYRNFDPGSGAILGGYVGMNVRGTGNTTFTQLGAGVEAVLPGVEFRVNGYLPVGDRRREVASETSSRTRSSTTTAATSSSSTTTPGSTRFQGNNLLFDLPSTSTLITTTTTTRNETTQFTRSLRRLIQDFSQPSLRLACFNENLL